MTTKTPSEPGSNQRLAAPFASRSTADLTQVSLAYLTARYGLVLDGNALVEVLRYPSLSALERSMQRGNLQLKTLNLPNRRGVFVHAQEMAQYLARASEIETDESEESPSELLHRTQIEKGA
jgi:hypothetical protein